MIKGIHHVCLKCDTPEAFERVKAFYAELLELPVKREFPNGIMFDTGAGLIEIFNNEAGCPEQGAVAHFALLTDDVDGCIERVRRAGYPVTKEPKDTVVASLPPWPIRFAFCNGPLGEEIEFFFEK